jgi:uncharacterized protein DUF222/HNH endonuclease
MSWDQLQPTLRLAKPDTDQEWAEKAPGLSPNELDDLARRARRVTPEEGRKRHENEWMWIRKDRETGRVRFGGELPDSDGELVETILSRVARRMPVNPETDCFDPWETRLARALVQVCGAYAGADGDPDRANVIIHADWSLVNGEDGQATFESGMTVAAETAQRLICDARMQVVLEDDGRPVGVSSPARTYPPWLRRLILRKRPRCGWPGCERTAFLHIHHMRHAKKGGETSEENGMPGCGFHHKMWHEGGWDVHVDEHGNIVVTGPKNRVLKTGPPPLDPDLRRRLFGDVA